MLLEAIVTMQYNQISQKNSSKRQAHVSTVLENKHKDEEGKYQGKANIISKFCKFVVYSANINSFYVVKAGKEIFSL